MALACSTQHVHTPARFDLRETGGSVLVQVTGEGIDPYIVMELKRTVEWKLVSVGFDVSSETPADIELRIDVERFDPGSQALRVLISFGAGRGVLVYDAQYLDRDGRTLAAATGEEYFAVLEADYAQKYGQFIELFAGESTVRLVLINEAAEHIAELALGPWQDGYALALARGPHRRSGGYGLATPSGQRVGLEGFAITVPEGGGWYARRDEERQRILLSNRTDPTCEIQIIRSDVESENLRLTASPSEIAGDFRRSELSQLYLQGQMAGNYQVENVVQGESSVDGRTFFDLQFKQVFDKKKVGREAVVDGRMYLHFPPGFPDRPYFYVLVFKDYYVRPQSPTLPETVIEEILASLEIGH